MIICQIINKCPFIQINPWCSWCLLPTWWGSWRLLIIQWTVQSWWFSLFAPGGYSLFGGPFNHDGSHTSLLKADTHLWVFNSWWLPLHTLGDCSSLGYQVILVTLFMSSILQKYYDLIVKMNFSRLFVKHYFVQGQNFSPLCIRNLKSGGFLCIKS